MGTKTITITNEAYYALSKERRSDESFSEVISRLAKERGKLSDCYGAWDMSDEEARDLSESLDTHWSRATEMLRKRSTK